MFPPKYYIMDFKISPYKNHNCDEYFDMVLSQWHVLKPAEVQFSDSFEKEEYKKQYDGFKNSVYESVKSDILSGRYRDYRIEKGGVTYGIIDVGTEKFEYPEVGIILKEEFRSRGYGYLIMKNFIDRVKKCTGCDRVIWRTEPGNIAAIALAIKLGGRESFETDKLKGFLI